MLRIHEIAEEAGVSPRTIWRWIASGRLERAASTDRNAHVTEESARALLNQRRPTNQPTTAGGTP